MLCFFLVSPGLMIRFSLYFLLNSYVNDKEKRIISPGLFLVAGVDFGGHLDTLFMCVILFILIHLLILLLSCIFFFLSAAVLSSEKVSCMSSLSQGARESELYVFSLSLRALWCRAQRK